MDFRCSFLSLVVYSLLFPFKFLSNGINYPVELLFTYHFILKLLHLSGVDE